MTKEIIEFISLMFIIVLLISIKLDLKNKRTLNSGKRKVLVDTSSLIDGRILSLAKTGFIGDELLISRSVLVELQLLADSGDAEKRSRARFGLDIVSSLQKLDQVDVTIFQDSQLTPEGVDNRLITLAKANNYLILTGDYNLNKVATIEGVMVLNINELSKNIRMEVLPGEKIKIKLTQTGESKDQAVGYLSDGTMIVVSNASKYLGKEVQIEITRSIQTDAGKMLFATIAKTNLNRQIKSNPKKSKKYFPKKNKRI